MILIWNVVVVAAVELVFKKSVRREQEKEKSDRNSLASFFMFKDG